MRLLTFALVLPAALVGLLAWFDLMVYFGQLHVDAPPASGKELAGVFVPGWRALLDMGLDSMLVFLVYRSFVKKP